MITLLLILPATLLVIKVLCVLYRVFKSDIQKMLGIETTTERFIRLAKHKAYCLERVEDAQKNYDNALRYGSPEEVEATDKTLAEAKFELMKARRAR